MVAELPQKGMHPDHLAAAIGERHILSLGTGQRNSLLRSGCPGDESFCHLDKVTGLGSTVKGLDAQSESVHAEMPCPDAPSYVRR